MAEVATLTVTKRETFGKRRNRRLRASGQVPAVLYGHQQEVISLAIPADEIHAALRHGSRFVAMTGALSEKALIKECQWDVWGSEVLHLDLTRVGEHEKIRMVIAVELRGDAPGTHEGGTVKHLLHELEVECAASAIPEKIEVSINHLALNQILHVADLQLPSGVVAVTDAAAVVVSCVPIVEVDIETTDTATGAEPEVIGRKKTDETEAE